MSHQDWTPVVIHGKAAPTERPLTKHYERTKEQKLEDEEIGTHKKVPLSMAKMIQQGRIAKGFKTQKDLAIAVGVNAGIISSYESGRAIPDTGVLQKLRRVLGVKLK
jgi:putative transcription factor